MADKNLQIRNSTVDFLIFTRDAKEEGELSKEVTCANFAQVADHESRLLGKCRYFGILASL